jgi:hypothetical protein
MLRGSQAQGSEERNDCFAAVFPLIRRGILARAAAKVKRYFEYLNAFLSDFSMLNITGIYRR